jgi:hypothetical protein
MRMVMVKSGIGIVAVLVGVLWILQGLNVIGKSVMSGHAGYAVLGIVVACIGLWLLWSAQRSRARAARSG